MRYLHIGNGKSIRKKEILGIFDLDTATVSRTTRNFIQKIEKEGKVEYTDSDLPRSFVVVAPRRKERRAENETSIRLSRISTSGLTERAKADM